MTAPQATVDAGRAVQELAARAADGICVRLLWDRCDDGLTVVVECERTGAAVAVPVESDRGLDAFYHPFVYAGSAGEGVLRPGAEEVSA